MPLGGGKPLALTAPAGGSGCSGCDAWPPALATGKSPLWPLRRRANAALPLSPRAALAGVGSLAPAGELPCRS